MPTYRTSPTGYDDPEAITRAVQSNAQNMSPAASGNNNLYQAGNNSSAVSHYGQGDLSYNYDDESITRYLNGNAWRVNKGDTKYNDIYNEYVNRYGAPVTVTQPTYEEPVIPEYNDVSQNDTYQQQIKYYQDLVEQLANQQYKPVDVEQQVANTMTYDEAYDLAKQIIEPQYQQTYQNTANAAMQNLEQSGLYNSLYGQALGAQAQQQVTADMNAAIGTLALDLQQMDYDQAMRLAEAMINENQFGANYDQEGLTAAAQGTMNLINSLIEQANMQNDFALQQSALRLQQEAQELDRLYMQGQLTQMQYENQMMQLEMRAQQAQNDAIRVGSSNTASGGGYAGNYSGGSNSSQPAYSDYQNLLDAIRNGEYSANELELLIQNANLTDEQKTTLENEINSSGLPAYSGVETIDNGREFQTAWIQAVNLKNSGATADQILEFLDGRITEGKITSSQAVYIATNIQD